MAGIEKFALEEMNNRETKCMASRSCKQTKGSPSVPVLYSTALPFHPHDVLQPHTIFFFFFFCLFIFFEQLADIFLDLCLYLNLKWTVKNAISSIFICQKHLSFHREWIGGSNFLFKKQSSKSGMIWHIIQTVRKQKERWRHKMCCGCEWNPGLTGGDILYDCQFAFLWKVPHCLTCSRYSSF